MNWNARASAKDEADIANEQEEFARLDAIWHCTKPLRLQVRGRCYNCGEGCAGLFCDVDCKADYERERRIKGRQSNERPSSKEHPQ